MINNTEQKKLELFNDSCDPNRANRLCVSLSDIHLTDGSVGYQNLAIDDWNGFYATLSARCKRNNIKEVIFVIDGDVVDMIRTDKWAKNKIYPWQREGKFADDFSRIVNEIIHDIVKRHQHFFSWLQVLPNRINEDTGATLETIVLLGNHDKELLCDQKALSYFYEHGLGKTLDKITEHEREVIGRMYGDESMFVDKTTAPYFPFYYGDRGFRFFTTHGQWRDTTNSCKVVAEANYPGWSAKDGWQSEIWQNLKFSPFLLPCFGDTVAAGVLSTFIYQVKKQLPDNYNNKRLMTIIDELDLYRPTYSALIRIIKETHSIRKKNPKDEAIKIIEDTIYACVIEWLSWEFTYKSSSFGLQIILRLAKALLKLMHFLGFGEIKIIIYFMKIMTALADSNSNKMKGVLYKTMKRFPAFMPAYQHYGFQIHGEGHTHKPLEEEPKFITDKPTTYINFGTWRDQIVNRKESGYRRRSVLRAFYILDLKGDKKCLTEEERTFKYYTDDMIKWSDKSDALSET